MDDWLRTLQQHLPPFALDVLRLSIWLVLLTLIFVPAERIWALRRQKIARKGSWTDLAYYFVNSIVPGFILAVPVGIMAVAVHRYMPYRMQTLTTSLPLWAHFTIFFLVTQIGFYWGHRWMHEVPFLWRFHAVHHSAEEIDWLVNTRAHPLDTVFTRLCGLAPAYALGLAQPTGGLAGLAAVLITLVGTAWGFFIHANVRWRFGWLEWVIATPAFHHWHHTKVDHRDHNYSSMLPWLDRLFGSYYVPKAWPAEYGIDTPMSPNIVMQLVEPIIA